MTVFQSVKEPNTAPVCGDMQMSYGKTIYKMLKFCQHKLMREKQHEKG